MLFTTTTNYYRPNLQYSIKTAHVPSPCVSDTHNSLSIPSALPYLVALLLRRCSKGGRCSLLRHGAMVSLAVLIMAAAAAAPRSRLQANDESKPKTHVERMVHMANVIRNHFPLPARTKPALRTSWASRPPGILPEPNLGVPPSGHPARTKPVPNVRCVDQIEKKTPETS